MESPGGVSVYSIKAYHGQILVFRGRWVAVKRLLSLALVFVWYFHVRKPTFWTSLSFHSSLACTFSQACCRTSEILKLLGKRDACALF